MPQPISGLAGQCMSMGCQRDEVKRHKQMNHTKKLLFYALISEQSYYQSPPVLKVFFERKAKDEIM